MSKKQILIVDDEESVLTVLKNSLKKLGQDYQIMTAKDGFTALDYLMEHPFDLVITDYNMAQMDGLELLEAIHYAQPTTQVIMITAYGSDDLEAEVQRLQVYRYLNKPLEIGAFRQIVQEALGEATASRPQSMLMLSGSQYEQINQLLDQLRNDVGARCIFLTDPNGHIVARLGDTEKLAIENIASLLGGGLATMSEAGRTLDGEADAINLAYREGQQEYLYALNLGQQLLLIIVINRGPYSSRLGTVWYHARQVALTMLDNLTHSEQATSPHIFGESLDEAFESELDKLFMDDGGL